LNCWLRFRTISPFAIENSRLYSSLQRKADEYERLKEFNENIVESINVGILAAGLDDKVESWNTQIEKLTGITRGRRVGPPAARTFSAGAVPEVRRAARKMKRFITCTG